MRSEQCCSLNLQWKVLLPLCVYFPRDMLMSPDCSILLNYNHVARFVFFTFGKLQCMLHKNKKKRSLRCRTVLWNHIYRCHLAGKANTFLTLTWMSHLFCRATKSSGSVFSLSHSNTGVSFWVIEREFPLMRGREVALSALLTACAAAGPKPEVEKKDFVESQN